jgi:tetratricopeptide (TPR) repeat protein
LSLDGSFQAVAHFQRAVDSEPDNAQYLGYLGLALQAEQRMDEAVDVFERALLGDDNIPAVLNGLGVIYLNRGDLERARTLLTRAQQAKPGDGAIQTNLAMMLARVDEHEAALKHAEKGLKLSPDNLNAHYTYGKILAESGQVEDAVRHFEKTIRQHRKFGGAYDHLARLKKFTATDRPFLQKAEKVLQQGMPAQDRLCLHFALGKMYDDCHDWDKSFEHYRQGNLLKKKDYDIKPEKKLFEQIKKTFNAKTLPGFQAMGNSSALPVFIVGMPRSGTTLMERMIASSDQAAGAGELQEIPRIAELIAPMDAPRRFSATARNNLTDENIRKYSDEYLHVLQQAGPEAERIVDKLPGNYFHLWLISILFPKATIIFASRHPLDTCLSCYFQNFSTIRWADDLQLIGEVYRFHREVMDYWKSVLPEGKIVEIQYERLVDDPENHGKFMLESCGLEWRGDGLDHYRQEKIVKTASLWQVRQPIYQSSKMRWKNYAPQVAELAAQLSDFLQDDRDALAEHEINLAAPSRIGRLKKLFV